MEMELDFIFNWINFICENDQNWRFLKIQRTSFKIGLKIPSKKRKRLKPKLKVPFEIKNSTTLV
jgi:hypothetical protein